MNSYTEEMKGRTNMLTLDKFEEASEKVKEVTLETKLIYSDFLSDQTGNKVYLKPENMQFTGAYKVRGAYYKISTLTDEERAKGLITASAGNHALGVACARDKQYDKAKEILEHALKAGSMEAQKNLEQLAGVVADL